MALSSSRSTRRQSVHEVAQAINADARVVYVDIDPVVVLHGEAILQDNPLAASVQGDVRQAPEILDDPLVHRLLDSVPGSPAGDV